MHFHLLSNTCAFPVNVFWFLLKHFYFSAQKYNYDEAAAKVVFLQQQATLQAEAMANLEAHHASLRENYHVLESTLREKAVSYDAVQGSSL